MRAVLIAAVMAMLASQARAAEIQVRCPALAYDAMEEFAAGFQRQTGVKVTVISGPMGKMVDAIQTAAAPPDVVILPPGLMDLLAMQGGVKTGTRSPLARVEIGLAVASGAPKPDISSVESLRAALLTAKAVTYTKPGPPRFSMEAQMIDGLLKRPEFSGVHALPAPNGSGVGFSGGRPCRHGDAGGARDSGDQGHRSGRAVAIGTGHAHRYRRVRFHACTGCIGRVRLHRLYHPFRSRTGLAHAGDRARIAEEARALCLLHFRV